MENSKPKPFDIAVKWAAIYVIASIVLTYTWQFLNIDPNTSVKYIGFLIFVVFLILALKEQRDKQGGFVTFGESFVAGLFYSIISAVVISIFTYLYFAILSPQMYEKILDTTKAGLVEKGLSSDQIDQTMSIMSKYGVLLAAVGSLFLMAIFGIIVSLIGAAIFKKERSILDIEQNSDSFTDPAV